MLIIKMIPKTPGSGSFQSKLNQNRGHSTSWRSLESTIDRLSADLTSQNMARNVRSSLGSIPFPLTSRNSNARFFATPQVEPTKCSVKENGIVMAYAANTNQGLVRNYNEDRVSIILNISKPTSRGGEAWPRCSFFGVYDGHGGSACADFLRDHLHHFVIKNQHFPFNPKEALKTGFRAAEKEFLELCKRSDPLERSGSCAVVMLIVGDNCYLANVGDSRAVMSGERGTKIYPLSKDHKPSDESEHQRIVANGGRVYQNVGGSSGVLGPWRVFPGRLSVSRSFGDIEAKLTEYSGNPNVLTADPEIKGFKLSEAYEFVVMCSDGVFDKMSNREVVESVWATAAKKRYKNAHSVCGDCVENLIRNSLNKKSLDNVTVVMIAFEGFIKRLNFL